MTHESLQAIRRKLRLLFCLSLVTLLVAASSATTRREPVLASMSAVQVQMGGNVPLARIISLELTVDSVQLVSSNGATATLVARPLSIEESHLTSCSEVVARVAIVRGSYTKALLTVANPHILYIDDFGNVREASWFGTVRATVRMKSPIVAGAAPLVVRISMDISSLFHFDDMTQTMTRGLPTFMLSQSVPGITEAETESSNELDAVVGKATHLRGKFFSLTDAVSGVTTTFLTDPDTTFNGLSLRTMSNLMVRVRGKTRADNQLLAQEVTVVGSGFGSVVVGIITNPAGTKIAMQQVYGAGVSPALLGSFGTIALDPAASFQVDASGMDFTGLGLTFGAANMVPGQRIEFVNRGAMPRGSADVVGPASIVQLQLQSVSGTVTDISVDSNGSPSFDLQLPDNDGSPLSSLIEGTTLVHVVSQALTKTSVTDLSEGTEVTIRGLLFFNPPSAEGQTLGARTLVSFPRPTSNYYLVARRISLGSGGR